MARSGDSQNLKSCVSFLNIHFSHQRVFAYEIAYFKKNITNFIMNFVFQFQNDDVSLQPEGYRVLLIYMYLVKHPQFVLNYDLINKNITLFKLLSERTHF